MDFRSTRQNTKRAVRPLRGQRAAHMHDLPDAVRERRAAESREQQAENATEKISLSRYEETP